MSSFFDLKKEADGRYLTQKTAACVCESGEPTALDSTIERLARSYTQLKRGQALGAQLEIEYRITDASLDATDFRELTEKFRKAVEALTGLSIHGTKNEVKYRNAPGAVFTLIWFEPCYGIQTGI